MAEAPKLALVMPRWRDSFGGLIIFFADDVGALAEFAAAAAAALDLVIGVGVVR